MELPCIDQQTPDQAFPLGRVNVLDVVEVNQRTYERGSKASHSRGYSDLGPIAARC